MISAGLIWAGLDSGQVTFRSACMCLHTGSQAEGVTVTGNMLFLRQKEEAPRGLADTYLASFKAYTHKCHDVTSIGLRKSQGQDQRH